MCINDMSQQTRVINSSMCVKNRQRVLPLAETQKNFYLRKTLQNSLVYKKSAEIMQNLAKLSEKCKSAQSLANSNFYATFPPANSF